MAMMPRVKSINVFIQIPRVVFPPDQPRIRSFRPIGYPVTVRQSSQSIRFPVFIGVESLCKIEVNAPAYGDRNGFTILSELQKSTFAGLPEHKGVVSNGSVEEVVYVVAKKNVNIATRIRPNGAQAVIALAHQGSKQGQLSPSQITIALSSAECLEGVFTREIN